MRISDWSSDVCSSDRESFGIVKAIGQRRDDMDGQFMLAAEHTIVELAGIGIVLPVAVADLALLDDAIEQQLFQLLGQVGVLDVGVLDFLFDVLFFVGQVFIGITIEIGRSSCRERGCKYVEFSVVALSLKKKK